MNAMVLTKKQLIELLEVMTPAQIRLSEKDHLDEDLLQFLAERESQPGLDDALGRLADQAAADWDDEHDPMPDFVPRRKTNPWFRRLPLVAAASLFIGSFLFWVLPQPTYIDLKPEQIKTAGPQRLSGKTGLHPFNAELFRVLKARGLYLLERAENHRDLGYFKEALRDFQQAYDLEKDEEIRESIIRILLRIKALDAP